MDTVVTQPVSQSQLRSVWPLKLSWIIIAIFTLWGVVGVYGFESILSNFYFLMFWLLTMIFELVLSLVFFIKCCIDFFHARKTGDAVLKKKINIRLLLSFVGLFALPFMFGFLGLMLLSLAPGLKY